MPKITNQLYKQFLQTGEIELVQIESITKALSNIKGRYKNEGRSLLILLYYTGCRPSEAIKTKAINIKKQQSYITIKIQPTKGSLPRTIYISENKPHIKELYKYSIGLPEQMYLFYHYTNTYNRTTKTGKEYKEQTNLIRYHLKQWFKGIIDITPYFLRHSRFSSLSQNDVSINDIMMIKGSKTLLSVRPYLHMSSKTAKKIARKIK